ncbi:MAG: DUF2865 domain-containing protein [Xanthobacteraceae bacterium]|nr:DUF2865 domain-containing protein [Xanthobacteraceae bacterium]
MRLTVPLSLNALLVAGTIVLASLTPHRAEAGFFDFLFGPSPPHAAPQGGSFADPFGANAPPPTPRADIGHSSGYCVRSCDGRYFPVQAHGGASPAQMCQAFCPATVTKVYFGGAIDSATTATGERYVDSDNAFAFRKALKADCTCNGRDPTGLAPVDLSLDTTLRPGDVIATSNGLVAYSGSQVGGNQTAEFTPVASYPGLTPEIRAKLGEMKVTPVNAEVAGQGPQPAAAPGPSTVVPKTAAAPGRHADLD